ncbi:LOW QUALITY PROTEIN: centrobin [Lissotriton helveticus]
MSKLGTGGRRGGEVVTGVDFLPYSGWLLLHLRVCAPTAVICIVPCWCRASTSCNPQTNLLHLAHWPLLRESLTLLLDLDLRCSRSLEESLKSPLMAWRASCPMLSSSLHSDDLMSDIEPLPASGPNSAQTTPSQACPSIQEDLVSSQQPRLHSQPSSPYAHRGGSSEVTAQLYASLRRSKEVEAQARAHLEPVTSSRRSILRPERNPVSRARAVLNAEALGHREESEGSEESNSQTSSTLSSPRSQQSTFSVLTTYQKIEDQPLAGLHQKRPSSPEGRLSEVSGDSGCMAGQNTQDPYTDPENLDEEASTKLDINTIKMSGSRPISEMESVRYHLQGMLRASKDLPYSDSSFMVVGLGEKEEDLSFTSDSTANLLTAKPLQEISPPLSITGMEELFPRYTNLRSQSVSDTEQQLRDSLEKERTRRKHLERHIQNLQNRLLELQQQLAIAASSDQKKNIMIEQLDKTLAKVVEGWNKQEAELNDKMRKVQQEKEEVMQVEHQQQESLAKLEQNLSQTMEKLEREQKEAAERRKQNEMLEKEKRILVRSLESEKQREQVLQSQLDEAVSALHQEQKCLETLRATLEEEQESWARKERQLEERYQGLQEESERQLESEKARSQKDSRLALDAKQTVISVQGQVQKLESELDATRRERDSLQMDITLLKARHESQKMKLESELRVALEKQITERLSEVHNGNARQLASVREQHRKQLLELSSHQEKELANQLSQFKAELLERDEKMRHVTEDYETRLAKCQEETRELAAAKKKLESQRSEMVGRLQSMMQSHWNEALRVLMNEQSPQAIKVCQVDKRLSDSCLALHDSRNSSMQKTMAVPPSKSEPLLPSEYTQQKLFQANLMDSLSSAASDLKAGENIPNRSSRTTASVHGKPKAAVQSFHRGHSEMSVDSGIMGGSHDHGTHNSLSSESMVSQAVSLHPANQRSSQKLTDKEPEHPSSLSGYGPRSVGGSVSSHCHNRSEDYRNFLLANQSNFYPLIASGNLTAELSQLLNYSFASQTSFHPLEPQPDETGLSTARHLYSSRPDLPQERADRVPYSPGFIRQLKAVLGHPLDDLAHNRLTDDTDNMTLSDTAQSEGISFQNTYPQGHESTALLPESTQRHNMQHYIRLLLDRTPGDPLNEKHSSLSHSMSQLSLLQGDHLGYRDRSTGIWDHLRQPPAGPQAAVKVPQAVQKSKVPEVATHSREHHTPPKALPNFQAAPITPNDVAEISRARALYQALNGQPLAEEILNYLQGIEQAGLEVKGDMNPEHQGNQTARRCLDPKLNDAERKEVVPVPRRPSSTRACSEKPPSTKTVKKTVPPPPSQGSIKGNRSGVWR